MTVRWSFAIAGLVLLLVPFGVSPAAADNCVLCGITPGEPGRTDESAPLEIELETTLDFDRVIVGGNGAGSVRLMPDGSSAASGAAELPSGRARIGRIIIHGEPNRAIYVDFPKSIELIGMKGTIVSVSALVTDLPDNPKLDSRGELAIDFGGELTVSGEADGDFRGNLLVRADYL
ncbi:MAG: DUF4402 domain-containing protein [Pseudomonadota bacterium]|nr:DUF4402 domain-containing protein [Pseudomonadota bacterium]